jgi:4'-phosphopantetheinyl transferase EntD
VSAHSSKLQIGPIPIKNECMTFEFKLPEIIYSYFSTESKDENVLTEGERILTKTWAKKRINDFSTGRFCARTALRNLNLQHHEILIGPKKEPLWPAGIVGSISHSDGMAGAIIACSSNCKSLGLDIENLGRVNPEMWYLLFTEKEQNFLNSLSPLEKDYYSTTDTYFLEFYGCGSKSAYSSFRHPCFKRFFRKKISSSEPFIRLRKI